MGKVLRETKTHKRTVIHTQLSMKNWQLQQLLLPLDFLWRSQSEGKAEPLSSQHGPLAADPFSPEERGPWVNCRKAGNRNQWWEDVEVRMGVQTLSWGGTLDSSRARWETDGGP